MAAPKSTNPATGVASFTATTAITAVKSLTAAIEKFDAMVQNIPAKEEEIRVLEEKKALLTSQIQEQERQAEVDLAIRIKENKEKAVVGLLSEVGKVAITAEQLAEHESLKKEFNTKLQAGIGAAVTSVTKDHANEQKQQELSFQVTAAADKSQIESLQRINATLQQQIATLTAQIDKDREARIQEAQARGTGSAVVVNSGK